MRSVALIALYLLPGAAGAAAYGGLVTPLGSQGYPPLAALLIAIGFVILPAELGVLWYASRGRSGADTPVSYREPMPRRAWRMLVPGLIVAAVIGSAVVALIEPVIHDALAGVLPHWMLDVVMLDSVSDYGRTQWIVTLVAYFVLNVIVGPVVEECYFRGYLLPRTPGSRRWAPLANAALFSLYHLWAPVQVLTRIAAVAPYAYAVQRKRSVVLGISVHMSLNAIATVTLMFAVFSNM